MGETQRGAGNRFAQETLSRQAAGPASPGQATESAIKDSGHGRPIPFSVRAKMEQAFGADLSGIRVHDDSTADAATHELNAKAFTVGEDVYFRAGQLDPGTKEGEHLLAHEVAHTRQQRGNNAARTIGVSHPSDDIEREAHAAADTVATGGTVPSGTLSSQSGNGPGLIARQDYGPVEAAGDVAVGAGTTLEVEAVLRTLYQRSNAAIVREAEYMLSQAISQGADPATAGQTVAKWVVDARNQAKVKIRKWDLDVLRILAERSNLKKYGDPVGPSYDQLRQGDPARSIKPRTDAEIIQGAQKTRPSVNKWVGRLRIAGRILIAIDIGIGVWKVATAPEVDRPRVALREISGLVGAAAGGWGGAKLGGMIGGGIGAWFGGAGAVPGAIIGAVIGGIGGAIGGGLAGREAGEFVADQFYPPALTGFEGSFR
ncbi:MAG: DUF4157 domain-containing protein [Chloroflexi bacterium]|nr:DUF4157 domain-containing protein [Chloroflexota bacterium]